MKKRWIVLMILLVIALVWIGQRIWYQEFADPRDEAYMESHSPDGRFTISTYVHRGFRIPWMMPGQGEAGNLPGIVVLRDRRGKTLQRDKIEVIQAISESGITWSEYFVGVAPIGSWPLPTEDGTYLDWEQRKERLLHKPSGSAN